jgi:Caspase domain
VVASRSALIVANGEYRSAKLRRLRAPARDADALARVLQDPAIGDFDVELVRDQPEHVLRRRIARFFADRRRDDLLLLHMSCHGLKDDDGHLFFATADTEFDDLDTTAVPEDFVRRQIAKSRSGRIVLLLDCCYSGAFSRGMAARAGAGVELKERFAGRGRAVITASNAMEYSFEGNELSGEGEPSIFTRAVVKALETGQGDRDLDGWIAVDELYDYVYDEVSGASPQHPVKWVDLEGDLRIAKSVYRPPAKPAELPPDLRQAIESPERHTRLGAVYVLGDLLAGSDRCLAKAARQALERLAKDDSRLVYEAANRTIAAAPAEPAAVASRTKTEVQGEPAVEPSARDQEPLPVEDEDSFGKSMEAAVGKELADDSVSAGETADAAASPVDLRNTDPPRIVATGESTPSNSEKAAAPPAKPTGGPIQPSSAFGEHHEPPVWSRNPRLAGDPRVGQQLSLTDLSVPPGQVALSYEWQRELGDRTGVLDIPDARDVHYELRFEDLGCRVRARIIARGRLGESVTHTGWSATVTSQNATATGLVPSLGLTGARAAGVAAVGGAIAAIASVFLEDSDRWLAWVWYQVPVAIMSVGVILLIGLAFRSDRRALLLAAAGLALVLLGVAFPMSYRPGPLPRTVGFWLGACGAAVAAVGAAFAAWLAYPEARTAGDETSSPTPSRITRAAFALPGPMIVIASLFVLPEWSDRHRYTTWINWRHDVVLRYPAAIILLCGVTMALAVWGIRVNRRRLLVIGAAVGCLVLGEAVPFIFTDPHEPGPWGSGRWLRIVGAVFAIAGLAAAGAMTRRDAPASRRYG